MVELGWEAKLILLPNCKPRLHTSRRERRTVAGQRVHSALYGTSESGDSRKEVWG